jgi:hypothetical protein
MNDIARCEGDDCLLRFHCFRFTKRKYDVEEMYFELVPCSSDNKTCEYLWNENSEWLFNELERLNKPTN